MRRDGSASAVLGRSKEMRAGLSMVNESGSVAGPVRRMVSCSCCPGSVSTSIACSLFASAALAGKLANVPAMHAAASHVAGLRNQLVGRCDFMLSGLPGLPAGLLGEAKRCGALDIAAEAVRNDFDQADLRRRDVGDLAVVLADVIADDHAMHELVAGLHEAV